MFPLQNNEVPSSAKNRPKSMPTILLRFYYEENQGIFVSISWIVWFQIVVCIWILNQSEVRSDLVARFSLLRMSSASLALPLNWLAYAFSCCSNYYLNRSVFVFTRPNWVHFISYGAIILDKLFNKGGHLEWKSPEMFLSKTFFESDFSLLYELILKSTLFG